MSVAPRLILIIACTIVCSLEIAYKEILFLELNIGA